MVGSGSAAMAGRVTTGGMDMQRRMIVGIASVAVVGLLATTAPASGARSRPSVLHQGVVTRQDVASQPGSETDTVVEPDVAVNPTNESNAVAAAHDSRYPDGGAVDISVAWTKDSGQHWHHSAVRGITRSCMGWPAPPSGEQQECHRRYVHHDLPRPSRDFRRREQHDRRPGGRKNSGHRS